MKGKELIRLIKENKLEEYDITVFFTDGYEVFPNVKRINIKGLTDISYSSKMAVLEGELD